MIEEPSRSQDTVALAKKLREGRATKGWTLRKAAAETGISNGYLSLIEQGEVKSPSPRYLMALADKYELAFEHLMALAGHPSGPVLVTPRSGPRAAQSMSDSSNIDEGATPSARTPVAADTGDKVARDVEARPVQEPEPPPSGNALSVDSLDATERQQLVGLVLDDIRTLSAADIAQVRAFIAGLRAARRR